MEHVWAKVEALRHQYDILREDRTPIDIFAFLEIDLRLDPIPFDDLVSRYDVEAAITADFTGIYIDAEQYILMEKGPEWKLNRLRFTVAHELAHFFLHQDIPRKENFSSIPNFAQWNSNYGGQKYTLEQEANEFAGRLLVPETPLKKYYDEFFAEAVAVIPNFISSSQIRERFADRVASRFLVNSQVIIMRLERDQIWPIV